MSSTNETPLALETVPIDRVFLSPTNPRQNDEAVPHVAASLRRFGWQQPIVARRTGEIIAGNTRLKAAQSLGMTEVPVIWFDGPDVEARAFAIADNRTHEFATWNEPALVELLEQLRAEDALPGTGFSEEDLGELLARLEAEAGVRGPRTVVLSRPGARVYDHFLPIRSQMLYPVELRVRGRRAERHDNGQDTMS